MPLLVGLLETSESRRSLDGNALPLNNMGDAELEEIAVKHATTGGGILDSTANMANSILGAGNDHVMDFFVVWCKIYSLFVSQVLSVKLFFSIPAYHY